MLVVGWSMLLVEPAIVAAQSMYGHVEAISESYNTT
jgi:hypothetical protein